MFKEVYVFNLKQLPNYFEIYIKVPYDKLRRRDRKQICSQFEQGKISNIIYRLVGGLKSSMGYLGAKKVISLRNNPNFVKITKAGFYESMVHNVDLIKNDNKY